MKRFLSIKIILLICLLGSMVCLIGCAPSVSVHTGTISGVINVYWPGVGFEPGAARIDVLDEGIFTVSSFSDGSYTLRNIPVGQHTIIVFKHGYITTQQIINVLEDQTITDVNFNLETEISAEQLGSIYFLGFNLNQPPFDNLKVRQVLNHTIDKQTLVNEFNLEFGLSKVVAQGPLPPSMMGYNSNLVGYSYDVNTAQGLLSQAGYPDGFNTELYINENPGNQFIAEKVKDYLAQVGISVEIQVIEDWYEYLNMLEQGDLPFFRMRWIADTPDPTDFLYSLFHTEGYANNVHYYNSVIDNQIKQAWETIDEANFVQLIQQIEENIVDDAPAIFIYH